MNERDERQQIDDLVELGWPRDIAELAVRNPGIRIDAIGWPDMTDEQRSAMGLDRTVDDFLASVASIERRAKAS